MAKRWAVLSRGINTPLSFASTSSAAEGFGFAPVALIPTLF